MLCITTILSAALHVHAALIHVLLLFDCRKECRLLPQWSQCALADGLLVKATHTQRTVKNDD